MSQAFETGQRFWKFRHPSVRDAMAVLVAERAELIDIYLAGVKVPELLREVVCGDVELEGARVHVPNDRFPLVISKLRDIEFGAWRPLHDFLSFMANRCSTDFLKNWFVSCPEDFEWVVAGYPTWHHNFCLFLARLHRLGCLPERHRKAYVEKAIKLALKCGESIFLAESVRDILTADELGSALSRIKTEFIPALEDKIDDLASDYDDPSELPSDYFDDLRSNLSNLADLFEDEESLSALEDADTLIDVAVYRLEEQNEEREEEQKRKAAEEEDEEAKAAADEAFEAVIKEYETHRTEGPAHGEAARNNAPLPIDLTQPNAPRNIFDDVDQ